MRNRKKTTMTCGAKKSINYFGYSRAPQARASISVQFFFSGFLESRLSRTRTYNITVMSGAFEPIKL